MDGVGTPIIGRPRPLPGHDTPNPAYHPHTPNYEEPTMDHQTARDKLSLRSPRQLRQLRSPAPQTAIAPQILLTRDDPSTLDSAQPHVPQSRSPDSLAQFAAHRPVSAAESDHGNAKKSPARITGPVCSLR